MKEMKEMYFLCVTRLLKRSLFGALICLQSTLIIFWTFLYKNMILFRSLKEPFQWHFD